MTSNPRIGCAILAAGASTRGERAQQLASVSGQSLVERVTLAACRSRIVRAAVIVCSRADEAAAAVSNLPVDIISSNPLGVAGLASSVQSAVGWARGRRYDALLLALVEPLALTTSLFDALILASGEEALQVVAAEREGILRFPALFPRDCYSRFEELTGDVDASAILRGADPGFPILTIDCPRGPRDLRALDRGPLEPALRAATLAKQGPSDSRFRAGSPVRVRAIIEKELADVDSREGGSRG